MIYVALLLLFLGLISILIFVLSQSVRRPGKERAAVSLVSKKSSKESVRETREIVSSSPSPAEKAPVLKEMQEADVGKGKLTDIQSSSVFTRPSKSIRPSVDRSYPEEEQLIVAGVLFIDQGRSIPFQLEKFRDVPGRFFSGLRRIGRASLVIQGSQFIIHCGNAVYTVSAAELEQVLFQDQGVAFVPILPDKPVNVFITEHSQKIKEYIQKRSLSGLPA